MERTVRDWYNDLPEHLRIKAFNANALSGSRGDLNRPCDCFSNAINMGIAWGITGNRSFWESLYRNIQLVEHFYGEDSMDVMNYVKSL